MMILGITALAGKISRDRAAGSSFTVATGGTITTVGDYKIHTFTGSSDFIVTSEGTSPNNVVEYLIVGAGGGSGGE